jgi:hypothetical protein
MKLIYGTLITLMVVLLAVSCGQKGEPVADLVDGFIYTNFADAKSVAESNGKQLVIDFYTDT